MNYISCDKAEANWDKATIPHINSKTNLSHPLSMFAASIWDSWLAQASVLLLFQYAAALSNGGGLIFFCKNDHSRISRFFSGNWFGLNNLCEILSWNLMKLVKKYWQLFGFPPTFYEKIRHI